ncbi:MAG TPA: hypothetical protein ENF26_05560 [Methanomicrobia archaeon]|nr:hypothetical protein [Methanomicrobia archaeon]HEX59595.1 hypothetical protein [Methanomicrobia archaeon]
MKKCPVCGKEINLNGISVVAGRYMHKPGCGKFLPRKWVLESFPELVEVKSAKKEEEEAERKEDAVAGDKAVESVDVGNVATAEAVAAKATEETRTLGGTEESGAAADASAAARRGVEVTPELVRRVFESRREELASISGVEHVIAGRDAIVVYVKSEEVRSKVPSELDGVPIKTFVVRSTVATGGRPAEKKRVRSEEKKVLTKPEYLSEAAWPLGERDFNCAKAHVLRKLQFADARFEGKKVISRGKVVGRLVQDASGYWWYMPKLAERPLIHLMENVRSGERWGLIFEGPVRRSLRKWWLKK